MKQYLFIVLSISLSLASTAQQKEFTLTGSLGAQSGETFSYRIVLTDSAGVVKGNSFTWFDKRKDNDTKAVFTGTIDRKNKSLSFKEAEILYNHDFESQALICLIKTKLRLSAENNHDVLVGAFTSANIFGTPCDNGSIRFEDEAAIHALFAETIAAPVEVKKNTPARIVVYDTATRSAPSKADAIVKITAGVEKIYEWNTDSLILDVWDGGKIDGDNITVILNNDVVLSRYTIAASKKQLRLPILPGQINKILIIANNTGNEPPNTANLTLNDGDIAYPVLAYNEAGNQAVIKIRRKTK